jgi:hypothetical protein
MTETLSATLGQRTYNLPLSGKGTPVLAAGLSNQWTVSYGTLVTHEQGNLTCARCKRAPAVDFVLTTS